MCAYLCLCLSYLGFIHSCYYFFKPTPHPCLSVSLFAILSSSSLWNSDTSVRQLFHRSLDYSFFQFLVCTFQLNNFYFSKLTCELCHPHSAADPTQWPSILRAVPAFGHFSVLTNDCFLVILFSFCYCLWKNIVILFKTSPPNLCINVTHRCFLNSLYCL
jgi:hypothetical protein